MSTLVENKDSILFYSILSHLFLESLFTDLPYRVHSLSLLSFFVLFLLIVFFQPFI